MVNSGGLYRGLVLDSNEETGDVWVAIPSLTGADNRVLVSAVSRQAIDGYWKVPPIGSVVLIAADDSNASTLFLIPTYTYDVDTRSTNLYGDLTGPVVILARNDSGSVIAANTVVAGQADGAELVVVPANANDSAKPAIGFAVDEISVNGYGKIAVAGLLSPIDTSTFAANINIFAGSSGDAVSTPVGLTYPQVVGKVLEVGASGSILVTIENTAEETLGSFSGVFNGTIYATAGNLGGTSSGWIIDSNRLESRGSTQKIVLDGTDGEIYIGTYGVGAYNSASTPFYVNEDGYFSLGQKLTFNPVTSTLDVNGTVTADDGQIGGWTIESTKLSAGSGASTVGLASSGAYSLYAGSSAPGSAPFSVTPQGAVKATSASITGSITATSGSIGGWSINGNTLLSNGATPITLDSSNGKITVGNTNWANAANKFYVDNAGKFSLGEKLTWDTSTLVVDGTITAASGTIGGWSIDSTKLYAGTGTSYIALSSDNTAEYRTWAGHPTASSAPYYVTKSGGLYASNASIQGRIVATSGSFTGSITGATVSGTTVTGGSISGGYITGGSISGGYITGGSISGSSVTGASLSGGQITIGSGFSVNSSGAMTSTSGSIGGFSIGASSLTAGTGASSVGLNTTGYPFYAGNTTASSAPFRVTSTGALTATSASITGFINATSGSFSGSISAASISGSTITGGSISGTSLSGSTITGGSISGNTITGGSVSGTSISGSTITGGSISGGYITGGSVSGGYITGGSISGGYITGGSISGSSVTGASLSGGQITIGSGFAVNSAGAMTSTSGSIGGFTIGATSLTAGTGASSVGLNTTGYPFYAGNTTASSAPFRVSSTGALTATSASITGNIVATSGSFTGSITSTSGSIGGFAIGSSTLTAGTGSSAVGISSDSTYPFWAGKTDRFTAPFSVRYDGYVTASSVSVLNFYNTGASPAIINGQFTVDSSKVQLGRQIGTGASNTGIYINKTVGTTNDSTWDNYIYADGTARIGNSTSNMTFDGTNLTVTGRISSTSGSIGGWNLSTDRLYSGTGASYVGVASSGTHSFWAGNSTPASAAFSVTPTGALVASSASITGFINATSGSFSGSVNAASINAQVGNVGGFTLGSTSLTAGTGASAVGLNTTGYPFYAGSTTASAASFRVTSTGSLVATTASITGFINATSGSFSGSVNAASINAQVGNVGGFTLGATSLTAGTGASAVGLNTTGYPFYAGSTTASAANFRVTSTGSLTATSASITGYINATSGSFSGTVNAASINAQVGNVGGFTLGATSLTAGTGASAVGLNTTGYPFYAGNTTPASAPFRVTNTGTLTATGASLTGDITASAFKYYTGGSTAVYMGSFTAPALDRLFSGAITIDRGVQIFPNASGWEPGGIAVGTSDADPVNRREMFVYGPTSSVGASVSPPYMSTLYDGPDAVSGVWSGLFLSSGKYTSPYSASVNAQAIFQMYTSPELPPDLVLPNLHYSEIRMQADKVYNGVSSSGKGVSQYAEIDVHAGNSDDAGSYITLSTVRTHDPLGTADSSRSWYMTLSGTSSSTGAGGGLTIIGPSTGFVSDNYLFLDGTDLRTKRIALEHVNLGLFGLVTPNPSLMIGSYSSTNMMFDNNEIQVRTNGSAAPMYLQYRGEDLYMGTNGVILAQANGGLRLTSSSDVNLTDASTQAYGLQIGADSGINMVFDNNEIFVRNGAGGTATADTLVIGAPSGSTVNVATSGTVGLGKISTNITDTSDRYFLRTNTAHTSPHSLQRGTTSGTTDASGDLTVTFNEAFTGNPSVVASPSATNDATVTVHTVSTTGFKVRVRYAGVTQVAVSFTFYWIAVGPNTGMP